VIADTSAGGLFTLSLSSKSVSRKRRDRVYLRQIDLSSKRRRDLPST